MLCSEVHEVARSHLLVHNRKKISYSNMTVSIHFFVCGVRSVICRHGGFGLFCRSKLIFNVFMVIITHTHSQREADTL